MPTGGLDCRKVRKVGQAAHSEVLPSRLSTVETPCLEGPIIRGAGARTPQSVPKKNERPIAKGPSVRTTRELGRRSRTLGPIGAYANAVFGLSGDSTATPEALCGVRMSAGLFAVLGVCRR